MRGKWITILVAVILCITIVLGVDYRGAIHIATDWVSKIGTAFNKVAGLTGVLSDRNAYMVSLKHGNLGAVNIEDQSYDIATFIQNNFIPSFVSQEYYTNDLSIKVSPSVYSFSLDSVRFNDYDKPVPQPKKMVKSYQKDIKAIRIDLSFSYDDGIKNSPMQTYHIFIYAYDLKIYYMLCDETFTICQLANSYVGSDIYSYVPDSYYAPIDTMLITVPPYDNILFYGTYLFKYFSIENFNETTDHIESIMGEIINVKGN